MKTLVSSEAPTVTAPEPLDSYRLLEPLFEVARESASLVGSVFIAATATAEYRIPKFLLLGQRGGGKPIRLALFAGLDASSPETTAAVARLLFQFRLNPALARDYALFAYPIVNGGSIAEPALPLSDFERRYAFSTTDEDVRYFKDQLSTWKFDGLLSLRTDPKAQGFYAEVRSELIGHEIALPALQAIAGALPLHGTPVIRRPSDRAARLGDLAYGKLTTPPENGPEPFRIEVFAPSAALPEEQRITGLFLIVQEILRNYRRFISHAADL